MTDEELATAIAAKRERIGQIDMPPPRQIPKVANTEVRVFWQYGDGRRLVRREITKTDAVHVYIDVRHPKARLVPSMTVDQRLFVENLLHDIEASSGRLSLLFIEPDDVLVLRSPPEENLDEIETRLDELLTRYPGNLVLNINQGTSVVALNEEMMRSLGWVRADAVKEPEPEPERKTVEVTGGPVNVADIRLPDEMPDMTTLTEMPVDMRAVIEEELSKKIRDDVEHPAPTVIEEPVPDPALDGEVSPAAEETELGGGSFGPPQEQASRSDESVPDQASGGEVPTAAAEGTDSVEASFTAPQKQAPPIEHRVVRLNPGCYVCRGCEDAVLSRPKGLTAKEWSEQVQAFRNEHTT